MRRTGILNPAIHSLLRRVRHTNTLVIADRGFPFWPQIDGVSDLDQERGHQNVGVFSTRYPVV